MMPRTRLQRFGLLLVAVFQLVLPTFVSVADAHAEAASERGAVVHVESHGTSRCVPSHSADCALCRVLATSAIAASAAAPVPVARVIGLALATNAPRIGGRLTLDRPSSRAPPVG